MMTPAQQPPSEISNKKSTNGVHANGSSTVGVAAEDVPKGHPRGLYVLFLSEMWERFGYYGMRALLVLYMIKGLGFTQARSSELYGWYTGLVYMTPIFGGLLAD